LADLPTLVIATNAGPQSEWRLGDGTVLVRRYHESNDSEVVRKWAVQGHGFAYRSLWGLVEDLQAGRLCLVQPHRWFDPSPVSALYHRNQFQPARLRLLLDFLQAEFAEHKSELAKFGF
jgi:DNA-binding transcriptional LysR family regulator